MTQWLWHVVLLVSYVQWCTAGLVWPERWPPSLCGISQLFLVKVLA